jgi:hypothetical protein
MGHFLREEGILGMMPNNAHRADLVLHLALLDKTTRHFILRTWKTFCESRNQGKNGQAHTT